MEKNFSLPLGFLKNFLEKDKKSILEYLGENCKRIYENKIIEVYDINSKIRTQQNYIPLEEMLEAIKIEYNYRSNSISIFIDEKSLVWQDGKGYPVYRVNYPFKENIYKNEAVSSLEEYWMTPIRGSQEEIWAVEETYKEVEHFIKKDFTSFLQKKLNKGKYHG